MTQKIIRVLDFIFAFLGLLCSSPILIVILIIGFIETRSPIFIQQRLGKNKKVFNLIKFRTMKLNYEDLASHLACPSAITPFGSLLRRSKLDELPQLINVLNGEMSLVGPRPCLVNQTELIKARDSLGVYLVLPGITGLAQVNNIDMSTPHLLAKTDKKMIETFSIGNYFSFILKTILGKGSGDKIIKR